MTPRSTFLSVLLGASYYVGGPLIRDVLSGGQAKILIYHGIPSQNHFEGITNYYGYSIPMQEFERHLIYLKRHCNVISIGDLLAGSNLSRIKTNVVLSFDDGYENQYVNAFNLLKQYNLPATFALPTAFVCNREPFWDDIVEYIVNHCRKTLVGIQWDGLEREFAIEDSAGRLALYNWLMRQGIDCDQMRRDELMDLAIEALEVSANPIDLFQDENYRPLTEVQVQEMVQSKLIEFASHTVHHYLLSRCSLEVKRTELRESKHQLEALTGLPCTMFCLPGGIYNSEVLDEAFQAGYECVLTSNSGAVENNQRLLNRNGIFREHDIHRFADLVHGPVLDTIAAARRAQVAVRGIFQPK